MLLQNKVLLRNKKFLSLFSGTGENGVAFYAYIMTTVSKFEEMERDFKSAKTGINVYSYGDIVEFGEGEQPDEATKAKMEAEYGFTHTQAA